MQFGVSNAHVARAVYVRLELRFASFKSRKGAHGNQLALCVGQVVAGEDVTEEVSLQVIVRSGSESIVICAAREFRLHLSALLQGVVSFGQRVGFLALRVVYSALLALVEHALQGA